MQSHKIALLIIAIVGIACYANSLSNQFVWDDEHLIVNNNYIRSFQYIPQIFKSDLFRFSPEQSNYYRPLQAVSYSLDYFFWKLNPFGYHLTNMLLHVCNALLVYLLILVISGNKNTALITGLFFVIHPVHTEAVTYISGRAELLAAFFIILSLIFFAKEKYLYSLLLFIPALLSKEAALILPLFLVLFGKRSRWLIAFIAVAAAYAYSRLYVFDFLQTVDLRGAFVLQVRLLTFFKALVNYFSVLFLPLGLHMERFIEPVKSALDTQVLLSLIFAASLLVYAYKKRNESRLVFFSVLFFFIGLIPVCGIIPVRVPMAEHWLYLSSIGFFAIMGSIAVRFNMLKQPRRVFLFTVLAFYAFLTIQQNTRWKDDLTFGAYTLGHAPHSYRLHNNLGNTYKNMGEEDKAIEHLERAIEIKPDFATAYNNLGLVYDKKGQFDKAIIQYERAIGINSSYATAYNNLGTAYDQMGLFYKAIDAYKKAISLDSQLAEAYNNLGISYTRTGRVEKAIKEWKKALEIKPDYKDARQNLEKVYGILK